MRLEHTFAVPAPASDVWAVLFDFEILATCLPGASARRTGERQFATTMTVRMGPMNLTYQGEVEILEADAAAWRAVIRGKAQEAKGQGSAQATTTAILMPMGNTTRVELTTDLQMTGRIAQMGRGIVDGVARHMLDQFAACFAARFVPPEASGGGGIPQPAASPAGAAAPAALSGMALLLAVVKRFLRRLIGR